MLPRTQPGPGPRSPLCRSCIPADDSLDKSRMTSPRIFLDWNADPLGDRADAHIAVIDLPAFVMGFEISAAGERGHGP
jgi:hypothetical protein